jgi:hypothetical protein
VDLKAQEKAAKIITEQAYKLGEAIKALREIKRLTYATSDHGLYTAVSIAEEALQRISEYGKRPEDL